MRALIRKEIRGFLGSLIGHIVIVAFLLITGLFLWVFPDNLLDLGYADLAPLFFIAPWVFLFLVPAVTMRSFSDERRSGTMELLLTKPISELKLVLAKYLAAVLLVFIALLPTLVYVFSVDGLSLSQVALPAGERAHRLLGLRISTLVVAVAGVWLLLARRRRADPRWTTGGLVLRAALLGAVVVLWYSIVGALLFMEGIDTGGTWGSYVGLFFLAACFTAIGVFASALTDNQIVAFLIALLLCFITFIGFDLVADFSVFGAWEGPLKSIGIQQHYQSISRGVIDLRDVLYFLGVIGIFVLLTRTVIQSRKW